MTVLAMALAEARQRQFQLFGDVRMASVRKRFEVDASAIVLTRRLRRLFPDPRPDAIPEDWLALLKPLDQDNSAQQQRNDNRNGRRPRDRHPR